MEAQEQQNQHEEKMAVATTASESCGGGSKLAEQATRISLDEQLFRSAIETYMDDNKPDQLSLKQIQGWKLEWIEHNKHHQTQDNDDDFVNIHNPTNHYVCGALKIYGEFMIVTLDVLCIWAPSPVKNSWGALHYVCTVRGEFNKPDKKDKVGTKIISRLKQDDYISLIIEQQQQHQKNNHDSKEEKEESSSHILAQAKIKVDEQNLEERVHVSEKLCESIKRSVWSSAESLMDIIDLILNLPSLPVAQSPLAGRAKLRLLEDAMCDACEQEGEEEILEDLKISPKPGDGDGEEEDEGRNKKRKK